MKTKASFGWQIVKVILIIVKSLFNKTVGFFVNLCIFMVPIACATKFLTNERGISLIIFAIVIYPIFFHISYKFFYKKEVDKARSLLDKAIYSIDNNE